MSFAKGEDVMQQIETILRHLWKSMIGENIPESCFPQMSYHDAMSQYGSDKPDLRLGMEVSNPY